MSRTLDPTIGLLIDIRQDALNAVDVIETNTEVGSWLLDSTQWQAVADQIDSVLALIDRHDITSFSPNNAKQS